MELNKAKAVTSRVECSYFMKVGIQHTEHFCLLQTISCWQRNCQVWTRPSQIPQQQSCQTTLSDWMIFSRSQAPPSENRTESSQRACLRMTHPDTGSSPKCAWHMVTTQHRLAPRSLLLSVLHSLKKGESQRRGLQISQTNLEPWVSWLSMISFQPPLAPSPLLQVTMCVLLLCLVSFTQSKKMNL